MQTIRILHLEDRATDAELLCRELKLSNLAFQHKRVETKIQFLDEIRNNFPDVIISDFTIPGFGGMEALHLATQQAPDIPFIFYSGTIGEEQAVETLKSGATDYVLKDNKARISSSVLRALRDAQSSKQRELSICQLRESEERHRVSEQRLASVIEATKDWVWETDLSGLITYTNSTAEFMLGRSVSAIIATNIHEYLHVSYRPLAEQKYSEAAFQNQGWKNEIFKFLLANGEERWLESTALPLKGNNEQIIGFRGVSRDVTERQTQQENLIRMARLNAVLSNINNSIVRINDKQNLLEEACKIIVNVGGYSGAVIRILDVKLEAKIVASVGVDLEFLSRFRLSLDPGSLLGAGLLADALAHKGDYSCIDTLADERLKPWHHDFASYNYRSLFIGTLWDEDKPIGFMTIYSDIVNGFNEEEQKLISDVVADISFALEHFRKQEQLNYLAYFDSLTDLPNRSLFLDRIGLLMTTLPLASNSNFAIIYIDIERFTNINETFGRAAGDILLCETASRLNQCLGEKGLLARIGADCFAFVYLDSHNGAKVAHLLENELANALTKPIRFLDQEIRVSTKAGIALFPADGLDAETILRGAEAALKSAKSTNSRYLFYNSIMNSRAAESLSIENRLRRALDEQQFVLYYQPKVNLKTGEIVGLEALIRWNEPDKGLIPPNQFIPILEETGLIVDVGYWVISKTHEQFKLWSHEGLNPPRIAVNVSQLQIRQRDFVKNVTLILHDLIAEEIEIEITESLFTENLEENIAKLDSLRKLGITVAIDDFGTGYSSLSYISKLPIDTLKIDRSFIKEMTTNPQQLAIVSTIISLGRSLDLKLVAEGVETKEEEAILKGYQCDEVQGYLISPPLHADKIPALLEKLKRNKVI